MAKVNKTRTQTDFIDAALPWNVRIYTRLLQWLCMPLMLRSFFSSEVGRDCGVGILQKLVLLWKFIRNPQRIPTASSWYEHLIMAQAILSIPKKTTGAIVECGAYKGGSTANLSLVCQLTGRQLIVFDSFAGLPQPRPSDRSHHCPVVGEIHTYTQGAFTGRLAEVKRNLRLHGSWKVCTLVPGYFDTSLPKFTRHHSPKIICVFADVDLVQSFKTCLKYLWPRLIPGGYWFTHEAQHQEIAQVFFDTKWWRQNLRQSPPGLIGAGTGLQFGLQPTALGYTLKSPSPYHIKSQL